MWSAGQYILNCYESSGGLQIIDKYYYTCKDKINDMVVAAVQGQNFMNPILACQDKLIRVLNDRGDDVIYSHKFDAACMSISLSADISERQSPILGFGLANGGIGVIELMRSKSREYWSLEPIQMNDGDCAPVSLVKVCNLHKRQAQSQFQNTDPETIRDFIVARDDGSVEIYAYVLGNVFPSLCYQCKIKSTITGIDFGHITMASSVDVLLSCYDGQIIALMDTKKFKKQGLMANEDAVVTAEEQMNQKQQKQQEEDKLKKIKAMEKEVEELKKKVRALE